MDFEQYLSSGNLTGYCVKITTMIDKKFFQQIKKRYQTSGQGRRQLSEMSNQAQFLSKQAIFASQRGDLSQAATLLKQAEQSLLSGQKLVRQIEDLENQGSYRAAWEEFAEAKLFYNYLSSGNLGAIVKTELPVEVYIGAVSDLVGEMVRYAVKLATDGQGVKVGAVVKVATDLVAILGEMNLTGGLRSKYDQAKHHLRRLEDIQYDLAIKHRA